MRIALMLLAVAAMAVMPVAAAQQTKTTAGAPVKASRAKAAPAPTTPVNLNTATQAQLEALPGVGPKAAERLIEYRKQNGSFKKVEDLMNVKGFGEKTFLKLKPMITVGDRAAPSGPSL